LILFGICHIKNTFGAQGCDFQTKTMQMGGGILEYKFVGSGTPILLLHGLFAQKEQWDGLACELASAGYQIFAPDLPGYGNSTGFSTNDYKLEVQADHIDEFISTLGLNTFNIAGSSMGGAIASIYARRHPDRVLSLAFIGSPLGIIEWSPQVKRAIFQGINPFIPIDEPQFNLEMHLLFYDPPIIPENTKNNLLKSYLDSNRHYQQVWDIVNLYLREIDLAKASRIRTLILWGGEDGIFNVSGVKSLQSKYPNHQILIISKSSHLPMLEKPKETGLAYLNFLNHRPINK